MVTVVKRKGNTTLFPLLYLCPQLTSEGGRKELEVACPPPLAKSRTLSIEVKAEIWKRKEGKEELEKRGGKKKVEVSADSTATMEGSLISIIKSQRDCKWPSIPGRATKRV